MSDLTISAAASLTGATLATNDLIPVLDVSASAGSKGSRITVAELFTGRAISGGTIAGITALGIRNAGTGAFDLTIAHNGTLTAARTLTLDVGDVAHTIALGTTAGTITFPNAAAVTVAGLQIANNFSAANTFSANGAISTPVITLTGSITTGGTGTTNLPNFLFQPTGATPATNWPTGGCVIGINLATASGSPSFFEGKVNGVQYHTLNTVGANLGQGVLQVIAATDSIMTSSVGNFNWNTDLILRRRAAAYLGLGTASATPITQTIGGAEGSGSNITGGTLNIGTRGTGTGTGGVINFQTHVAGSSGSTLQTLTTMMSIQSDRIDFSGLTTTAAVAVASSEKVGIYVGGLLKQFLIA